MFKLLSLFKPGTPVPMGEKESNDAVRAQLAGMGDDGVAERHVLHYAYPPDPADLSARAQLIADMQARGLEVRDAEIDNGLVMEQTRSVAGADFDDFTTSLRDRFALQGWAYDGWECAVVAAEGVA